MIERRTHINFPSRTVVVILLVMTLIQQIPKRLRVTHTTTILQLKNRITMSDDKLPKYTFYYYDNNLKNKKKIWEWFHPPLGYTLKVDNRNHWNLNEKVHHKNSLRIRSIPPRARYPIILLKWRRTNLHTSSFPSIEIFDSSKDVRT